MSSDTNQKCRDAGDHSYHVGYTLDSERRERENLTHAEVIESDSIEDREETEFEWTIEKADDGNLLLLHIGEIADGDGELEFHFISKTTALQLADMFTRAAALL
jgi:hypothetical protein